MSRKISVSLLLAFLMSLAVTVVFAQDGPGPRPTPTDYPKTGSVRGFVYMDVNGDGRCVETGVAGEVPIAGIPVKFTSSDGNYVFTHNSGENGAFELAAAGLSNWQVAADPDSAWIVTSENPRYALVTEDRLLALGVNFCVQKTGTAVSPVAAGSYENVYPTVVYSAPPSEAAADSSGYVLPEAGASAPNMIIFWPMLVGLGLITLGIVWRWYEISRQ